MCSTVDSLGQVPAKKMKGFAVMDKDRQRAYASQGGRKAHAEGRVHKYSPEQARAAGHLGGLSVSRDREYMVAIGRRGGIARAIKRAAEKSAATVAAAAEEQPVCV